MSSIRSRPLVALHPASIAGRVQPPALPRILFITADWPTGAAFAVTVARFARIVPAGSIHEGVQKLAEGRFGLVILGQAHEDDDLRPLLRTARARRCGVLVIAEAVRIPYALDQLGGWRLAQWPITIQALVERAWSAFAAHQGQPPQLGRPVSQAIEQIRGNYHSR